MSDPIPEGWTVEPVADATPDAIPAGWTVGPISTTAAPAQRPEQRSTVLPDYVEQSIDPPDQVTIDQQREQENAALAAGFKRALANTGADQGVINQIAEDFNISPQLAAIRKADLMVAWKASKFDPEDFRTKNPDLAQLLLEHPDKGYLVTQETHTSDLVKALRMAGDVWDDVTENPTVQDVTTLLTGGAIGPGSEAPKSGSPEEAAAAAARTQQNAVDRAARDAPKMGTFREDALARDIRENHPWLAPFGRLDETWAGLKLSDLQADYAQELLKSAVSNRDVDQPRLDELKRQILEQQQLVVQRNYGPAGEGNLVDALTGAASSSVAITGGAVAPAGALAVAATGAGGVGAGLLSRVPGGKYLVGAGLARGTFRLEFGSTFGDSASWRTDDGQPLTEHDRAAASAAYAVLATGIEFGEFTLLAGTGKAAGAFKAEGAVAGAGAFRTAFKALTLRDPAFRNLLGHIAASTIGESGEEGVQSLTQDAIEWVARSMVQGYASSRGVGRNEVEKAFTAAGQAGPFSIAQTVGAVGVGKALASMQRDNDKIGQNQVKALSTLDALTAAGAAPELAQLVADVTARTGNPVTSLYVDAEALGTASLFQSEAGDQKGIDELLGPGGQQKLEDAIATGGKVEVPRELYLKHWAGTPLGKAMAEHTTVREGAPTPAQQKADPSLVEQQAKLLADEAEAAAKSKQDVDARFADMEAEVAKSEVNGRPVGKQKAKALASIWRAVDAQVRASFGHEVADEVLAEARFEVSRGGPAAEGMLQDANGPTALESRALTEDPAVHAQDVNIDRLTNLRTYDAFNAAPRNPDQQVIAVTLATIKPINDSEVGGHDTANVILRHLAPIARGADPAAARKGTTFYLEGNAATMQAVRDSMQAALPPGMAVEAGIGADSAAAAKALDETVTRKRASGELPKLRTETKFDLKTLPQVEQQLAATPLGEPNVTQAMIDAAAEASPEDRLRAYHDKVNPNVLNELGFELAGPAEHVGAVDIKGLKADFNEAFAGAEEGSGKWAGDLAIANIMDVAVKLNGHAVDFAHLSGDEFAVKSNDKAAVEQFLADLRAELLANPVKVKWGPVTVFVPVQIRFGVGEKTYGSADRLLNAAKSREAGPDGSGPTAAAVARGVRKAAADASRPAATAARAARADLRGPKPEAFAGGSEGSGRASGGDRQSLTWFESDPRSPEEISTQRDYIARMTRVPKREWATKFLNFIIAGKNGKRPAGGGISQSDRDEIRLDLSKAGFIDPEARWVNDQWEFPSTGKMAGEAPDARLKQFPSPEASVKAMQDLVVFLDYVREKGAKAIESRSEAALASSRQLTDEEKALDAEYNKLHESEPTDAQLLRIGEINARLDDLDEEARQRKFPALDANTAEQRRLSLGPGQVADNFGGMLRSEMGRNRYIDKNHITRITERSDKASEKMVAAIAEEVLKHPEGIALGALGKVASPTWKTTAAEAVRRAVDLGLVVETPDPNHAGRNLYFPAAEAPPAGNIPGQAALEAFLNEVNKSPTRLFQDSEAEAKLRATIKDALAGKPVEQATIDELKKLFAGPTENPRGSVQHIRDGVRDIFRIALNPNADLSTFLHESSHVFLELFADLAQRDAAPQQVKDDFAAALKWLGADAAKTGPEGWSFSREQHEKWARGFEAYLREGKSPSLELIASFKRFAKWLTGIYKSISQLGVELNPEIRGVFDRLLATEQEISDMGRAMGAPLFGSLNEAVAAGLTPEQYAGWLADRAAAEDHAARAAKLALNKEALREKEKEWKAELEVETEKAGAEYEDLPARVAQQILLHETALGTDGFSPFAKAGTRLSLNRAQVEAAVGVAAARKFRLSKDGANIDEVANTLGTFPTGAEMLKAIEVLPPKDVWVSKRAEWQMKEKHPGLLEEREKLRDIVGKGMHGDESVASLMKEIAALTAQVPGRVRPVEVIASAAKQMVERMKLRELNPNRHLQAERSAANAAIRALAKGDLGEVLTQKHNQLLSMFLYRETLKAKDERTAFVDLSKELDNQKARAKLGLGSPVLRDAVDFVLEAIGLKEARAQGVPAGDLSLAAQLMEEDGTAAVDLARVTDAINRLGMGNWEDLTLTDMRLVKSALLNMRGAARLRGTVQLDEKRASRVDVVEQALAAIDAQLVKKPAGYGGSSSSNTVLENAFWLYNSINGALLRPTTLLGDLSGGDVNSIIHRAFIEPLRKAKHVEADLAKSVMEPIIDAFESVPKEVRARFMDPIDGAKLFPGHNENSRPPRHRYELLMMLANSGNAGNLSRMLGGTTTTPDGKVSVRGRNITQAQLLAALNLLTKSEIDYVQSILDAHEKPILLRGEETAKSLKERAFELEERLTGLRPEAVVAQPLVLANGTLRGGYFPAVYDRQAEQVGERQVATTLAQLNDPSYTRPGTDTGYLQKRVPDFVGVVSLEPGTIYSHLNKSIHDIAFREALASVGSLILDPKIDQALKRYLGDGKARQFLPWLKDIGTSNAALDPALGGMNKVIGFVRGNMAPAILGWKASVALGDIGNLPAAVAATPLKAKFLASGLSTFLQGRAQARAFALEMSGELRHQQDTLQREFARNVKDLTSRWRHMKLLGPLAWWKDHAFFFMETSQAATATPIWIGAYHQAFEADQNHESAVKFADNILAQVFPSHSAVDQSAILRSKGFWGLSTVFYGYMNTAYNAQHVIARPLFDRAFAEAGGKERAKKVAVVSGSMLALWIAVGALSELFSGRGPEAGDDDDETSDDPLIANLARKRNWLIRKTVLAPLTLTPAGAVTKRIESAWLGKPQMPGGGNLVEAFATQIGEGVVAAFDGDSEVEKRVVKMGNAIGLSFGIPTAPLNSTGKYVADSLLDGTGDQTPAEVASGLVYGKRKDQPETPVTFVSNLAN